MLMNNIYNRLDYILIWGHGLKYKERILSILEEQNYLKILKIYFYEPKSINRFVKQVYSYDYAPFYHLKAKTRYLLNTPKKVLFIFVENSDPQEDYFGEGDFRHLESTKMRQLKWMLREEFNPRCNGEMSHNHVIHISDNEQQTYNMLQYLGFKGMNCFQKNILDIPYHIKNFNSLRIKSVDVDKLYCRIACGNPRDYKTKPVPLGESPHYRSLIYGFDIYENYLIKYHGYRLQDYYSLRKYKHLVETLNYLSDVNVSYICVSNVDNKLIIMDGLHRASILKWKNNSEVIVAELF